MDDREQQRKIWHRLAVLRHAEEVTGNVAATCHYYGISRPTFYKWRNRYEELGPRRAQGPQFEAAPQPESHQVRDGLNGLRPAG